VAGYLLLLPEETSPLIAGGGGARDAVAAQGRLYAAMVVQTGLERFHECLDLVVVTGSDEVEDATACAEDEAQSEASATFEIITLKSTGAQTGMQMWCAKPVADGVDNARNLAAA
jgi:hypothetical protein